MKWNDGIHLSLPITVDCSRSYCRWRQQPHPFHDYLVERKADEEELIIERCYGTLRRGTHSRQWGWQKHWPFKDEMTREIARARPNLNWKQWEKKAIEMMTKRVFSVDTFIKHHHRLKRFFYWVTVVFLVNERNSWNRNDHDRNCST